MKRIVTIVITVVMGLSTVGFLPEAQAAISVHKKAENVLRNQINKARENRGLDRLRIHAYIRRETRRHSKDMSRHGFFSHQGFQGRANRITRRDPGIDGAMCENIAWASGYTSFREVVRVFFNGWLNSQPHRECMFDIVVQSGTDSVGIGIVRNGDTWHATYIASNDRTPGWTKADRR